MNAKNDEALVVPANTGTHFQYKARANDESLRYCLCGCELQVVGKKVYRPGHDARHVSQVVTAIVEFVEVGGGKGRALTTEVKNGLGQFQSPRLIVKAAERLMKNLGEKHMDMISKVAAIAIEALQDDEDEDSED